jgi:hypothetical protein
MLSASCTKDKMWQEKDHAWKKEERTLPIKDKKWLKSHDKKKTATWKNEMVTWRAKYWKEMFC